MIGHVLPKRTYLTVWSILMGLLALTVFVATMHLGRTINIIIAMTIAVIKAVLVILFFMHVKYSSKLIWVFAAAGFVWFVLLVAFTLSDYNTRAWLPVFAR